MDTTAGKKASSPSALAPCRRCKEKDGIHTMRDDPTCDDCFVRWITTKTVKRLEAMNKELKELGHAEQDSSPRYAVALSFGPSSTALFHALHETMTARRKRNSKGVYQLLAVHVDTDDARPPVDGIGDKERLLDRWRERYPDVRFERVSLKPDRPDVLQAVLPPASSSAAAGSGGDPDRPWGLGDFFASLPSATSRSDMSRILVQQQLMSWAVDNHCTALLLGHTTTALSELAIAEVAKGRGFGVPWLLADGPIPLHPRASAEPQPGESSPIFPVYRLLREVFRRETSTYAALVAPTLQDLLLEDASATSAIVSLKDVGIEEVVARYFDETEKSYQSIVSNVVRTVGKLDRPLQVAPCAVCNLPVDGQGEARWKGEIGADESAVPVHLQGAISLDGLCYGCKRSLYG